MKKILSTIVNVFKNILVVLMIIVTLSLLVMKIIGDTPSILGYNLYYIATPSMEPDLKVGDIILSKEVTDVNELKIHDVITYQGEKGSYANKLITHEIIDIQEDDDGNLIFITKGTNNPDKDPAVEARQIRNVMICEVPLLGDFMKLINHPAGFLILIILPLGICLIGEVKNLVKVCKGETEEEENEKSNEQN